MQNLDDQSTAFDYARKLTEYGGMYHEGDLLVVLFTSRLAEHDAALRSLVNEPDRLVVAPGVRTWSDIENARNRVEALLLAGPLGLAQVHGVGIGLVDGQFTITVSVSSTSSADAEAVRAAAAPDDVIVRFAEPVHRLVFSRAASPTP